MQNASLAEGEGRGRVSALVMVRGTGACSAAHPCPALAIPEPFQNAAQLHMEGVAAINMKALTNSSYGF